jgi:hypothetical protein
MTVSHLAVDPLFNGLRTPEGEFFESDRLEGIFKSKDLRKLFISH